MARTVEDATRLLSVMAGVDPMDPTTTADPSAVRYADYTQFLDVNGANDKRIGILQSYGDSTATPEDSAEAEAVAAATQQLRALGAEVVGPLDFEDYVGTYLADYEPKMISTPTTPRTIRRSPTSRLWQTTRWPTRT